jgi:sugar phosphate isomerase/epimerase
MLQLKKGIRLSSLRLPFKQALHAAADIGAEGVEIDGRTELRPAEMSRTAIRHLLKMMSDLNLRVAAIHFPTRRGYAELNDLERRIEATKQAMTMAYELGCAVVTNGLGPIPAEHDQQRTTMIQALTDLGNFANKSGAWLAATAGLEDPKLLYDLIRSLPPMAIGVDFDPASMIINGHSTIEAMKLLGADVMHFRARDAVYDAGQGRGLEVQMGRGSVELTNLLAILEEHGYSGYITVDRDVPSDAVVQCGYTMQYLDNLFK